MRRDISDADEQGYDRRSSMIGSKGGKAHVKKDDSDLFEYEE